MPYTVKGMDMSFSGILTYFEDVISLLPHLKIQDKTNYDSEEELDEEELNRRKRKTNKNQGNRDKLKAKLP